MGRAAVAGRSHVDFARIGLGIGDELGDRLGRNRWMHQDDHRDADDAGDRGDVADEVEIELVVERRIDRIGDGGEKQRVSVRLRIHDGLGAEVAAGSRPIFDDEILAEPLGQPLPDQARGDVDPAAGRKADDDVHRPCRIGLRPGEARHGRERGSARCQA